MHKKAILESDIVKQILQFLKKEYPSSFFWKTHGGMYGTAGLPDICGCIDGRFVAFEVKRLGGKTTPLQRSTLDKLGDAGAIAIVVFGLDEVIESVEIRKINKQRKANSN